MAFPLNFKQKFFNGRTKLEAGVNLFRKKNGTQGLIGSFNLGGQDYLITFMEGSGQVTKGQKEIAGWLKFTKLPRVSGNGYNGPYSNQQGPYNRNGGF